MEKVYALFFLRRESEFFTKTPMATTNVGFLYENLPKKGLSSELIDIMSPQNTGDVHSLDRKVCPFQHLYAQTAKASCLIIAWSVGLT